MNVDDTRLRAKPLLTISECLRAQLTMRRAHRPAHSIGGPGCFASTNEPSTWPAAPFSLLVASDNFEHFKPVILINRSLS
jgi:hypothetical protein